MTGLKYDFDIEIAAAVKTITQEAARCMWDTGNLVALKCLADAQIFLTKLPTWMMTTYHSLLQISPDYGADNWKYISHCVRTIFEFIHDVRKIGAGLIVHGSYVMWACLQGQRAAAELVEKDFSGCSVDVLL